MDRMRAIATRYSTPFDARWSLCATPAGAVDTPGELRAAPLPDWLPIDAPDTVAGALRRAGRWSFDAPPRRFDEEDWWFRAIFETTPAPDGIRRSLAFDGLAGACTAWLNGELLLTSDNMHVAHDCALPPLLAGENELLMRFASLDAWLARRRPRPRWRAPMIEHQQLRWARVSLLGRTPGWSPPAPAIGPWRTIEWVDRRDVNVSALRLRTDLDDGVGRVILSVRLAPIDPAGRIDSVTLRVSRNGTTHDAVACVADRDVTYAATLAIPGATPWWPHTHGEPALYDAELLIQLGDRAMPVRVDLGRVGFRTLTVDTADGGFALHVNGVPVFCRGANWTPLDVVSPAASAADTRAALAQVRAAGLNMLRVNGCMVYEDDAFFDACDALGLLVWQDFMFANMDYPADDEGFAASVDAEARQQLARWQAHPSLAVICGNSEVAQQAAMWGAPRETWTQPLFDRTLAFLARAFCPDVPYWPSSAHGGAFPHQNDVGTTSYYGVGAYLRPMEDARRSRLRFASECLAFANVPSPATLARMPGGASLRPHHPGWKARTPRDRAAGWDFEDVRDHYLERLYSVDPVALRSTDPERYLQLGRAVGAHVVETTIAEWRRPGSVCGGALVWFLRDLWAGAGWGVLDDRGVPKAAFHGLRRASAPIHLFVTDEGTNGLALHVVNDPQAPFAGQVDVALYRDDGLCLAANTRDVAAPAHGGCSWAIAEWFDSFIDLSRAYRFGPGDHALVVATLHDKGRIVDRAFFLPDGLPAVRHRDVGLAIDAVERNADGSFAVSLSTRAFAQSVHFDLDGYLPEDDYFHMAPGESRVIRLAAVQDGARPPAHIAVRALNAWSVATCEIVQ